MKNNIIKIILSRKEKDEIIEKICELKAVLNLKKKF